MAERLEEMERRVLVSLVDGYRAREGMKSRTRALTEYEVARRASMTQRSYVEYSSSEEYHDLRDAFSRLEGRGLVSYGDRAGRYDTFVPTDLGVQTADRLAQERRRPEQVPTSEQRARKLGGPPSRAKTPSQNTSRKQESSTPQISAQLKEIITLLRSIDTKLGHLRS